MARSLRDQPLWQFVLAVLLLLFVLRRAAAGLAIAFAEGAPVHLGAYGLQILLALVTGTGIWLGRRWARPWLLALGASIAATALLEAFFLGVRSEAAALSEALIAAVATGGLFVLLSQEESLE